MGSIKHTASFEIREPAKRLFPLFSAEGEKRWVPGWDYQNLMGGIELHEDYVFTTKCHDHAASEAIWIVKRYVPERHLVQFYKVEPGDKLGVIEVRCTELDQSLTRVDVSYEYIGLSPAGDEFIAQFSSTQYKAFIAEWKRLLLRYLDGQRPAPD